MCVCLCDRTDVDDDAFSDLSDIADAVMSGVKRFIELPLYDCEPQDHFDVLQRLMGDIIVRVVEWENEHIRGSHEMSLAVLAGLSDWFGEQTEPHYEPCGEFVGDEIEKLTRA